MTTNYVTPPSVLLMGPTGTGKTFSIVTMMLAGIDVFVIGTEPNFADTLLDAARYYKADMNKLHFHSIVAMAPSWDAQFEIAHKVHTMSYSALADIKDGIAKSEMKGWLNLLLACKNFRDDITGREYGDVTGFGDDKCIVIDSLSGLNQLAREYVSGYKPNLHPGEWGTAMEFERNLIYKVAGDRHAFFVLIAHIDRTVDEVTQASRISVAALGQKLGPRIPQFFSEVIFAKREKDKFLWSTKESGVDVKNRALPIRDDMPPDFRPIVAVHRQRVAEVRAAAESTTPPEAA